MIDKIVEDLLISLAVWVTIKAYRWIRREVEIAHEVRKLEEKGSWNGQ